jgi:uncharacterized membrane protein YeaQ/YmgE (transglycosylase-associated protein family)
MRWVHCKPNPVIESAHSNPRGPSLIIEFETARALRFSIGGTHMSLLWTLIIGAIAGWLAGTLVKGRGFGLIVDIIVGIVGAFIGGWVFGLLGLSAWGLLGQLCMATVGAVILLVIIKAIKSA